MSPFFTKETEKLLSKLVDDANIVFLYLYTNGNIAICNKKVADIAGKTKEDIVGKHWLHVLASFQAKAKSLLLLVLSLPAQCLNF